LADSPSATTFLVEVPGAGAGLRLDRFLAGALPHLSRSRLKALIEAGRVSPLAGAAAGPAGPAPVRDPSRKVRAGQAFRVAVPPAAPAAPAAQAIPLEVVYEDDDIIVIDKPAGLVVHPAPGNPDRTLVNALLAHCRGGLSGIGGVARPGIVHRLDKGTSGLMVAAKNDAAHAGLARQFARHALKRGYLALVWGVPHPGRGEIAGNIGRSPRDRKKMAVVAKGGKAALTRYRVRRTVGTKASLVECWPATGRTHQIRVHLAAIGHPLVGDPQYGGGARGRLAIPAAKEAAGLDRFHTQALHAYLIEIAHPRSRRTIRFISKLPRDIKDVMTILDGI
jgi:23S rRNA pseudouridine1911/1915/1917 synthase